MTSNDEKSRRIRQGEPSYDMSRSDEAAQRSRLRTDRDEERRSATATQADAPARTYDLSAGAKPDGKPNDPDEGA